MLWITKISLFRVANPGSHDKNPSLAGFPFGPRQYKAISHTALAQKAKDICPSLCSFFLSEFRLVLVQLGLGWGEPSSRTEFTRGGHHWLFFCVSENSLSSSHSSLPSPSSCHFPFSHFLFSLPCYCFRFLAFLSSQVFLLYFLFLPFLFKLSCFLPSFPFLSLFSVFFPFPLTFLSFPFPLFPAFLLIFFLFLFLLFFFYFHLLSFFPSFLFLICFLPSLSSFPHPLFPSPPLPLLFIFVFLSWLVG